MHRMNKKKEEVALHDQWRNLNKKFRGANLYFFIYNLLIKKNYFFT